MKFLRWLGERILRNRPASWFILAFLILVAIVGLANAETRVWSGGDTAAWSAFVKQAARDPSDRVIILEADAPAGLRWVAPVDLHVIGRGHRIPGVVVSAKTGAPPAGEVTIERALLQPNPGSNPFAIATLDNGEGLTLLNVDFRGSPGAARGRNAIFTGWHNALEADLVMRGGSIVSTADAPIGQGNHEHGAYIHPIRSATFDGVLVQGVMSAHALKVYARNAVIVNNVLRNFTPLPDGSPDPTQPIGTTLIDLGTWGRALIANNVLEFYHRHKPAAADTGNRMVDGRNRHTGNEAGRHMTVEYGGADWLDVDPAAPVPDGWTRLGNDRKAVLFRPHKDGPTWNPEWWAQFGGSVTLDKYVVGNRFQHWTQGRDSIAVTAEGTRPKAAAIGTVLSGAIPVPDPWRERARWHIAGNTYEGENLTPLYITQANRNNTTDQIDPAYVETLDKPDPSWPTAETFIPEGDDWYVLGLKAWAAMR